MSDQQKKLGKEFGIDEEVLESPDTDTENTGGWEKILQKIVYAFGVLVTSLVLYEAFFGSLPPNIQRPVYLFLMVSMGLMVYPSKIVPQKSIAELILKIILLVLLLTSTLWAINSWIPLYKDPVLTSFGLFMGLVLIMLALEVNRRVIGFPMVILTLIFIIYCFAGPYLPRFFAHRGFSLQNIIVHTVVGTEGMMGTILGIGVNQIIYFMMFAAFLKVSNATDLFMTFSTAIAGRYIGGPAKVAVVSSGLLGMVSGSASGNVATTGSVTIPLMIKMGFANFRAGAIEAVASTAGQFMPPIMGASAFVIAEYTGKSYWEICVAAFIPSVIFYIGVLFSVDIQARKRGLKGLPASEIPAMWPAFKDIIPLLFPLFILTLALALKFSPRAAIISSVCMLVLLGIPFKKRRFNFSKIMNALAMTGKYMIVIVAAGATAGMIVGIMSLTGLGERLSYGIVSLAGGNLFIGLLLTGLMAIIIGMGLPTLSSYIVIGALGAPALHQMGAPLLAAHMFIFYCATLSAITPPVCLASYVAAGIANAKPLKVGFESMITAPIIYIIPFMFFYRPGILLSERSDTIIIDIIAILVIALATAVLTRGYYRRSTNIIEVILIASSVLFIIFMHTIMGFVIGIACIAAGIISNIIRAKKTELAT